MRKLMYRSKGIPGRTCYDGTGQKCDKGADFVLNDGQADIPGGYICREHAIEVLQEYYEKLNYHWHGIPIDIHGSKTSEPHLHPNPKQES